MKKGAVLAGVCLPALILLAGCRGKNNLRIAGGGMVKNAALVTENTESALAVELPLITDRELRDVEVTDTHLSGEGALRFDYKGMTEGGRYKGYYYYFMHFSALVSREEKTDLKVESIDLLADGESVKYRPDTLTFMNSEAYFGEEVCAVGDALLYEEAPVLLKGTIPDDPDHPDYFSLEVNRDCTLREFCSIGILDLVNVEIQVNGVPQPLDDSGISLHEGDDVAVFYNLAYTGGSGPDTMVKTSWYMRYEEKDGRVFVLEEPQGFMVFNVKDDSFVKAYIDRLKEPEPAA